MHSRHAPRRACYECRRPFESDELPAAVWVDGHYRAVCPGCVAGENEGE